MLSFIIDRYNLLVKPFHYCSPIVCVTNFERIKSNLDEKINTWIIKANNGRGKKFVLFYYFYMCSSKSYRFLLKYFSIQLKNLGKGNKIILLNLYFHFLPDKFLKITGSMKYFSLMIVIPVFSQIKRLKLKLKTDDEDDDDDKI